MDTREPTKMPSTEPGARAADGETPRPSTTIEMQVVESRVHERLFGAAARVSIGRFEVIGPLGAGGMGVVFAAHDPELDRKVAIKLVAVGRTGSSPSSQARLLAEAQTMAKLSHPNIVTVHEVGTHEGGVYVAMEYIDGETLDRWIARARPGLAAIMAAFEEAGRGLAAAHLVGVVHRDFKPSNAMIDRGGRVRVLDFGLAIDETKSGTLAITRSTDSDRSRSTIGGTPLYMAPEIADGSPASALADQYAFCVSLWSALFGAHPYQRDGLDGTLAAMRDGGPPAPSGSTVPAWARRVLARGLGPATKRWPTMDALLEALAGGRARERRRRIMVGSAGVACVIGSVLVARQLDVRQRTRACEREGAEIDAVWNDEVRASAHAGIVGGGTSWAVATAEKVLPRVDEAAAAWRSARTTACLEAGLHGHWDADTLDRSLWCLDGDRMELESFVGELAHGRTSVVQGAVVTAAGLGPPASCLDREFLERLPPPPPTQREAVRQVRRELHRSDTVLRDGDADGALAIVRAARAQAEGLEWPPLVASVKRREANLLERTGAYAEAEALGREAYFEAARVDAWQTAASAAVDLGYLVGLRQRRTVEGLDWVGHAEIAESRAPDPMGLRVARRLGLAASIHMQRSELPEALAAAEETVAIVERAFGPDHPIVANGLNNLGATLEAAGELERAREVHERGLAIRDATLGPDHPDVATSASNLASVLESLGQLEGAAAGYERALAIRTAALGPDHPLVAKSQSLLAAVLVARGELARARDLQTRALATMERAVGPEHGDVGIILLNLGALEFESRELASARAHLERALAIQEKAVGVEHPTYAQTLTNLAEIRLALGEHASASEALARAVAIFDAHEGRQGGELEAHFLLAKALVATGGDRLRARAEAELARVGFRELGPGKTEALALVDAWLAEHPA
jgi:eukaryotic-like serine/threonine-protein kinase